MELLQLLAAFKELKGATGAGGPLTSEVWGEVYFLISLALTPLQNQGVLAPFRGDLGSLLFPLPWQC